MGSARGFTPAAALCSWGRGLCVSQSFWELSDSAELQHRPGCGDPSWELGCESQPNPWCGLTPQTGLRHPKKGTACTAPAPPGLLECQSTGSKTLKSFSGSLDAFCVCDSTFSSKHQENEAKNFLKVTEELGCLKLERLWKRSTVFKERGGWGTETINEQFNLKKPIRFSSPTV